MNTLFYIFLTIIIIVTLLLISYICAYNRLQIFKIKIDEAEVIIDEALREEYDLLSRISDKCVNFNKYFKTFDTMKSKKISNFDLDRKLTEGINIYYQLVSDKLIENDIKKELMNAEQHLDAAKAYFNSNTSELNKIIRQFPNNIVAGIHKVKIQTYFDRKDLNDEDINDFKL